MEVPNVKRKDYQLIGMEDEYLSLMDDTGDTRDDLKCPDEGTDVGNEVRNSVTNETDILVRLVLIVTIQNDLLHNQINWIVLFLLKHNALRLTVVDSIISEVI